MIKKVSVLGTRDFHDKVLLESELKKEAMDVLVTGGRLGPDLLAAEFAIEHEITQQVILPDYQKDGRSANYFRNRNIIEHSTTVLIFWNERSRSLFNYLPYIKELKKDFRTIIY